MYRHNQALVDLLEPDVTALGFEFVGVEYVQQSGRSILRVYIDKQDGIVIEDCVAVSEQLSRVLDVEDPISGHYDLEVSSPGMDRPLFTAAHFHAAQGKTIRLRLFEKLNNRRRFTAVLKASNDDTIVLQQDDNEFVIPLSMVEHARLVPKYEW